MEPPPSQSDMSISHPSIFVNRDGSPIQVFTEACGIKGRPKLMRTLRNFGASLSCDPKSAQIILVDQETTDGKKFIRNWGQDKTILHYTWAKKSIQEGKALLKDCNWGECLTVDDGLPIETEDTDAPELDNPLPTPRVTPDESKTKRPARASRLSNPAPEVPIKQDLMVETQSTNDIAPAVTAPNLSQNMPAISSMPMNVTESFPQTSYTMQMPNMTSMPPPMTPMMMAQITQYMMMMNSSNYPYNSQAQPNDFNSALIDALRIHNGQWPSSQLPQESPLQSNMYDRQTVSRSSTQQNYPYPNLSSNLFPGSNSQSTPVEAPARKRRRASSASSDSVSMQDVSKIESESESTSPVTKRPKASPRITQSSERKLFQSKSGKELSFFVQIEMHNRSAVVAAIKKHGGKIEGNNEIADYAILASGASKTKTFKDLLFSTVAAGRPALSARFVHESVVQNTLLDPRDFAFESPPMTHKRTVKEEETSDVERKRLAKNERESARRRQRREEATAQSSTQPQKKKESISNPLRAHSGPPSPTPPLMHTREAVGSSSHFKFTDSERTYAMKYVQVLLARDHDISGQAIGAALHNKMPHHPVGSWRTHICAPSIRDEIDRLRKRAGIAFRKAQEQKQSQATQSVSEVRQQNKPESESEVPAVTPVTPSPTLVGESESDKKMAEEDDFNVIVAFFAGSPDEDENESVVWGRLTSQATCKTASNWEEFYNMHHEEVVKRYEKLCASNYQQT